MRQLIDRMLRLGFSPIRPRSDTPDRVQRLSDAVAPYALPSDLAELYTVSDGTGEVVYNGLRLDSVDEIISDRSLYINRLGYPSSWLILAETKGGGGPRMFTTLLSRSGATVEGIWEGHSHDAPITKVFDSIPGMFATLADICEECSIPLNESAEALEQIEWREDPSYRLRRNPQAWSRDEGRSNAFVESTWVEQPDWPDLWRTTH